MVLFTMYSQVIYGSKLPFADCTNIHTRVLRQYPPITFLSIYQWSKSKYQEGRPFSLGGCQHLDLDFCKQITGYIKLVTNAHQAVLQQIDQSKPSIWRRRWLLFAIVNSTINSLGLLWTHVVTNDKGRPC